MAQCKETPHEFIKNTFTPQIAVMSSSTADWCCQKNNLSFIELLQPFSKLNNDMYYKDTTGNAVCIRNLKLTFLDANSRPPETILARKYLNSSVSDFADSPFKEVHYNNCKLDVPVTTPWFESWREIFLRVQYPSDHEYTKHFLSCILVVSSLDVNPVESTMQLVQVLNQMQTNAPDKLPKWFSANILKYIVVIHDNVEGNINVASEAMEKLKSVYGQTNCFLLRINSRPSGSANTDHLPDPWSQFINKIDSRDIKITPKSSPHSNRHGNLEIAQEANEFKNVLNYHPLSPDNEDILMTNLNTECDKQLPLVPEVKNHGHCLSTDDIEQIKLLIHEFSKICLLPYIEKQIFLLNDVVSNKKGVSKSLFSATKRWFSPNKPGASSVAVDNVTYPPDAPELQIRRLGDLYFMFGHYSHAFQAYHLAKRDYNTDQAWLYYAGALEMASLSAFMANESTRKTYDYMEESITTYLNTCKRPQFATRATIISSECLKNKNMFGEAAHQLIRMTSEESDLRSALLLEQAAYCFLQSKMIRKYAFHMVLAGHRYSKAAQRKHSLRCYKQAYQVYENTGWDLAADHIHYTIGRQANNLQQFNEAVQSFSQLLKGGSKQSAQQQAVFLKEYLTILRSKLKQEALTELPKLPVPQININLLKVLVGPTPPLTTPGKVPALGINFNSIDDTESETRWTKLEEMLVTEAGAMPMVFKPIISLYHLSKLEKSNVIAVINEPIQLSIQMVNSLQTILNLKNIFLLWNYSDNDDELISNETNPDGTSHIVKTHITKTLTLNEHSRQDIILTLTPLKTGNITITGICYTLNGSATSDTVFTKGKQSISLQPFLNKPTSNSKLKITIVPAAPCLQVTFSEVNLDFLTNELQRVTIEFQNTGTVPLKNILIATSVPNLTCNSEFQKDENHFIDVDNTEIDNPATRDKLVRKNHISSVPLINNKLDSGQAASVNIWIKAPHVKGSTSIDLLIYYENLESKSIPRYRLVRHSWKLTVQDSIEVELNTQGSFNAKTVEELALAIKTTNLNNHQALISSEVRLLNIGLLSRYWKLTKNVVTPKFVNLKAQESAHVLLKAKRANYPTSQYTNIPVIDKNLSPNMKMAFLAFAKKAEQRIVNIFDDYELLNCNKYMRNNDGYLLVQWQAVVKEAGKERIVHGQTQLPVDVIRLDSNEYQLDILVSDTMDISEIPLRHQEYTEMKERQVMYNLIHPSIVKHNFEKQKICIISVGLLLHSVAEKNELLITINTLDACEDSQDRTNLSTPRASNHFRWLVHGKLCRTLNPLQSTTEQLTVVLPGPGTYDLGAHIEVYCRTVNGNIEEHPVLQACQIQSALVVANIKS